MIAGLLLSLSLLMAAAVDFDVVAHVGYVKNIDLSHKVNNIT